MYTLGVLKDNARKCVVIGPYILKISCACITSYQCTATHVSIPLPSGYEYRFCIKGTLWLLPGTHTDLVIAVEDRGTFWYLVDMHV